MSPGSAAENASRRASEADFGGDLNGSGIIRAVCGFVLCLSPSIRIITASTHSLPFALSLLHKKAMSFLEKYIFT